MNNSLILILAGVAGVLFHCLLKLNSLLKKARTANVKFNAWNDYWKKDAVSIFLSFLSVGIWYMIFGEVSRKYPAIQDFVITSYVVMGALGSYILQKVLSRAEGKINEFIDVKTNISDKITGVSANATLKEVVEKGTEMTGEDVTKKPTETKP